MAVTIKRISRIKNLGIFRNYTWTPGLSGFRRYNVIYGMNGAGKTTLSKLLATLNSGYNPEFASLEYNVVLSDNSVVSAGSALATPIRVFNQDYKDRHIDFERQSSDAIRYTLTGDEGILKAIKADEIEKARIETEIKKLETLEEDLKKVRGNIFTDIAKTINQGTQHNLLRTYNKTHAVKAFKELKSKNILDQNELLRLTKSISQNIMQTVPEIPALTLSGEVTDIIHKANRLLQTTVESAAIDRLKENPDISEWAERGAALHRTHNSKDCEFCGNGIQDSRLEQLAAHFSAADAKLKSDVEALLVALRQAYKEIEAVKPLDKMNLYEELREEYSNAAEKMSSVQSTLLAGITAIGKTIKTKKQHTTEKLPEITATIELEALAASIDGINAVVKRHNDKTDAFENRRTGDCMKIEAHFLSTIYDKIQKYDKEADSAAMEAHELRCGKAGDYTKIGLTALANSIAVNKARVRSTSKACKELNDNLSKFLGHNEISFEVNEDETGYLIKRGAEPAKNLSEGEKTAIAYVFFVVSLKDENFDSGNGIIVMDDPVSTLDSTYRRQAFSFLQNAAAEAAQLFVFTHDLDFLELVESWFKNDGLDAQYFTLENKNSEITGERGCILVNGVDQIYIKHKRGFS